MYSKFKSKLLIALVVFGSFSLTCKSQDSEKQKLFLWEISGRDLPASSYLFGSMHLNDSRIFGFSDSLYYAFRSCSQFATEIDVKRMDSLFNAIFVNKITGKDDSGDNDDESDVFDVWDINGKPVFLDLYLYKAAKNKGMLTTGLESKIDMDDLNDVGGDADSLFAYGLPLYEKMISIYKNRDTVQMLEIISASENEDMDSRNEEQTQTFLKLASQAPTFAVVGAAHTIGKGSVIERLQKNGYHARLVGEGDLTNGIVSLYAINHSQPWKKYEGKKIPFYLEGPANGSLEIIHGIGDMHASMELEKGTIYMTMVFPPNLFSDEQFLNLVKDGFVEEGDELVEQNNPHSDSLKLYKFSSKMGNLKAKGRVSLTESGKVLQVVTGLSISSFQYSEPERYFNSLKFKNENIGNPWKIQTDTVAGFRYYFPEGIDFLRMNKTSEKFADRGEFPQFLKVHTEGSDSYVVLYQFMPTGVLTVAPYKAHELAVQRMIENYQNSELVAHDYSEIDHNLVSDVELKTKAGDRYFVKIITRGFVTYILLQNTAKEKNSTFFESFELITPSFREDSVFNFDKSGFSIKMPGSPEKLIIDGEENYIYGIRDAGIVLNLSFEEYGKYEQFHLNDDEISYQNLIDDSMVDSLISFETFEVGEGCHGYHLRHTSDSSYYFSSEFGFYCNNFYTQMVVSSPNEHFNSDYVDNIFNAVNMKVDQSLTAKMKQRKLPVIIADLDQSDSAVFNEAKMSFESFSEIEDEDIGLLIELFKKDLIDENDIENVDYMIVTHLHDFLDNHVNDQLVEMYNITGNPYVKSQILRSINYRYREYSLQSLFDLLKNGPEPEVNYPSDLFSFMLDSLEIFEKYYPDLKDIIQLGEFNIEGLEVVINYLDSDYEVGMLRNDSLWLKEVMEIPIQQFLSDLRADSSSSVPEFIMDYYSLVPDTELTETLYGNILQSGDEYGAYRIIYNKVKKQQPVPLELWEKIIDSEYYYYWSLMAFWEFGKEVPQKYKNPMKVSTLVAQQYYYDKLDIWCDNCELISELKNKQTGVGKMLYLRCSDEENENEPKEWYYTIVGPFDKDNNFKYEEHESVYYQLPKTEDFADEIKGKLLDYLKSQEE